MNLLDVVNQDHARKEVSEFPDFRAGDTLIVHVKITEGAKSRIQLFQGTCVSVKKGGSVNGHFRVRKVSSGVGVERVFPFHGPCVSKIELVSRGKSRRAKHYYLRERSGKGAKLQIDYERQ